MEKIINGQRYDTNKAKLIGEHKANGMLERLFLKKTGEFFLLIDNSNKVTPLKLKEQKVIKPLDYEDAKNFCQEYLSNTVFEKEFGAILPSSHTSNSIFRLHDDYKQRLERLVQQTGQTQSELIEELIDRYLGRTILITNEQMANLMKRLNTQENTESFVKTHFAKDHDVKNVQKVNKGYVITYTPLATKRFLDLEKE